MKEKVSIKKAKNESIKKASESSKNYKVEDISISELIPNNIDNVIVSVDIDNSVIEDLPTNFGNIAFKLWKKNKGGIFSKDIRNSLSNKQEAKYIILTNDSEKIVARLIEDDELGLFSSLNLINGKVKDKPYMVLKTLGLSDNLTTSNRFEEAQLIIEESGEEQIFVINNNIIDEEIQPINSISLFD